MLQLENESLLQGPNHFIEESCVKEPADEPSAKWKWLIFASVCLASVGVLTDGSIIGVALPQISSDLALTENFGWGSSAYLLTACVAQPISGRIYSSRYRKQPLLYSVVCYHLGSILCALGNSSVPFIVGRGIAGLGAGSLFVGTQAVIVSLFSAKDVALCMSIFSLVSLLFALIVPVICGIVIDAYSWRPVFLFSLPFSLAGSAFLWYTIQEDKPGSGTWWKSISKVDLLGTVLLFLAFVSLLTVSSSNSIGWACARLLGFAGLMSLFGYVQYRSGPLATIPPDVFTQRQVWAGSVIGCSLEMAMSIHLVYLPLFYQAVKNYSSKDSGVQEMAYMFTLTCGSFISGIVARRSKRIKSWISVGIIFFAIAAWFLTGLRPQSTMQRWLPYVIVGAFGAGTSSQLPFVVVTSVLEAKDKVSGNTILVFAYSFGGPIGTSLAQTIFSTQMHQGLRARAPELDSYAVIAAGPTQLRTVVPMKSLDAVLRVYADAVSGVLCLALVAVCIAGIGAVFLSMSSDREISDVPLPLLHEQSS